jgi:hypothetical protein
MPEAVGASLLPDELFCSLEAAERLANDAGSRVSSTVSITAAAKLECRSLSAYRLAT